MADAYRDQAMSIKSMQMPTHHNQFSFSTPIRTNKWSDYEINFIAVLYSRVPL